jgi:hypothetical protein
VGGEGAHGLFAIATQALEKRPARRVGESPEEAVIGDGHERTITRQLWNAIHN